MKTENVGKAYFNTFRVPHNSGSSDLATVVANFNEVHSPSPPLTLLGHDIPDWEEGTADKIDINFWMDEDEDWRNGCQRNPEQCDCESMISDSPENDEILKPYLDAFAEKDKGVIIAHSNYACAPKFLEQLIALLKDRGAKFVDPERLLNLSQQSSEAPYAQLPSQSSYGF